MFGKLQQKFYILNFSGGKDSTFLFFYILENKLPLDYVIFCDTGVEYEAIYKHIEVIRIICKKNDIQFIKLQNDLLFFDYIFRYRRKRGKYKEFPYTFPSYHNRWCTGNLKIEPIRKWKSAFKNVFFVNYIGYTFDEKNRANKFIRKYSGIKNEQFLFPLIDKKITEKDCLNFILREKIFEKDYRFLYEINNRVSCWCCPFSRKQEILNLFRYFPEKVNIIKKAENYLKSLGLSSYKFQPSKSIYDYEKEFKFLEIKGAKK